MTRASAPASVELVYREYGSASLSPLMLLHGLFGSSANWHSLARKLSDEFRVIVPDLRNHGRSPHAAAMRYPDLAIDLGRLLDRLELDSAAVVGHSMGAKVGMWLALAAGARVDALVAVDSAPVTYPDRFGPLLAAMQDLRLESLSGREQADRELATVESNTAVRAYLLQNLVKTPAGWQWRLNLPAIAASIRDLTGFPDTAELTPYPGDSLFLYGTQSDYVTAAARPVIQRLFPHARLRPVAGAGHWVYSERPDDFLSAVHAFLR